MIKKILHGTTLSFFLFMVTVVSAEAKIKDSENAGELKVLTEILTEKFRAEPSSIEKSVIPNMYQVMYGTQLIYVSSDGKYFLSGDLIKIDTGENMSDVAKQDVRIAMLDRQDNRPVVFKAENEKHVLKVFTDIDCPYCAKLHREVPQLNAKGITIEYLMFPRAGLKSASFTKAVSMWCADDNKVSMTDAKERKPIASKTCDNPITDQFNLAQELGVTGTPALITASGKLIPGYMPADRLEAMILAENNKN